MGKVIHDTSGLDGFYPELKKGVDRAVVAAAFNVRDRARSMFRGSGSLYKHKTSAYKDLDQGIQVGKFNPTSESIEVHALGTKRIKDTYKTRFFVGGTVYRKQTKVAGKKVKPYSKGYIKANDVITNVTTQAQSVLKTFIENAIKP